jgi:CheY-like chemotaxis protein
MAMIVIAEDEFLLSDMLQSFLADSGYEVAAAAHGREALDIIRQTPPALIITDFMMPLMTGLELAMAVRADPVLMNIPIILVSGAQGSIGRDHPEAFNAVLDKPYQLAKLLETVEQMLTKSDG